MAFTLQPAVKGDFIDRDDILADMITTLRDKSIRMGFALVGPRRIGKTSILKEVAERLYEYFLLKGVLQREKKGIYQFTDPVFKVWLKESFIPTNL